MTASPKINLVYNKYVSGDDTKNISNEQFYTNLQTQTQLSAPLCVYLTNGTNKKLDGDGSGTTAAFKQLSDKSGVGNLFNLTDAKTVFDSSSNDFKNKNDILSTISNNSQVWNNKSKSTPIPAPYNGMYAGSVIRVDASGNGNKDFPVCGGYHINGIKLNDITDSTNVETNSVELVKAYYTAIMEDFFKIATAAGASSTPVKHHVLHLAQIPGDLYGGTDITGNAFHTAVKDWIAGKGKANVTPPLSMSMTISVDFKNPAGPPPAPPKLPVSSSSSSLQSRIAEVTDTKKSHPLFTVANEIYNAFFATMPKTGTKESLTAQLTQIENAIPRNKDAFQSRIDKVKNDLQNAVTSTATTTPTPTPPVKPVAPTKKDVVFAFDIDNTLVQHGTLESSSSSFNATTHAADYNAMLNLMKEIINARHYVWIVTANNKITKDNFEKIYLKSDTDTTSISNSDKYYFMNPALVTQDLSGQFKAENFTSFNTSSPPLTHDLSFKDDVEFQSKGLKPYAMRAKWMQLEHKIDDANVEMYLFDDNTEYQKNCNLLKVKFVKVTPSGVPPPFRSNVLKQATDVFEKNKTTSVSTSSGGRNLNVMTFNTWYLTFNASSSSTESATFCKDSSNTNKCQNNIRQAILDHMKHEQSIVFLQEFTYKFDEFFKVGEVTVNNDGFASKTMMATESKGVYSSIPAFRYFTMKYDSKTFHVYIGQIGQSVIATIYSDTFHSGPADAFFVGNLAAGNLKAGSADSEAKSYDLAYTFSGTKSSLTEKQPPKGGYPAFGGNRPFIILRFDTKKCVLVNVHVPHGADVFKEGKPTGSLADFAFNALARFIPDTVFKNTSNKDKYAFILGGDFNTDNPKITEWLKESLPETKRDAKTCCTTDGGLTFGTAVDHIFSTLPITKYEVHKIVDTEKTSSPPPERYYFSDHLPVYAEINFTPAATSSH
jgi:hypothetical protein